MLYLMFMSGSRARGLVVSTHECNPNHSSGALGVTSSPPHHSLDIIVLMPQTTQKKNCSHHHLQTCDPFFGLVWLVWFVRIPPSIPKTVPETVASEDYSGSM